MKIEHKDGWVKLEFKDGALKHSSSVTDILLFKILEQLENVNSNLIDLENQNDRLKRN